MNQKIPDIALVVKNVDIDLALAVSLYMQKPIQIFISGYLKTTGIISFMRTRTFLNAQITDSSALIPILAKYGSSFNFYGIDAGIIGELKKAAC